MATKKRPETMAFHALQEAFKQNKLRIYLDYGRINKPN